MKRLKALAIPVLSAALIFSGCSASGAASSPSGSAGGSSASAPSSSAASSSPAARTVRIGFVDTGNNFPSDVLGIAEAKGYFDELKKANVTVQLVPFTGAGPAINEALAGKSLDMADLGDVPALTAKSNGIDTVLVAVSPDVNDAVLVVPAGSGITSVIQLKGKKIATQKGSYMHRTLFEMLAANGMTVNDIQFVNMTSLDAASAIVSKSVDAAVLATGTAAKVILDKSGTSVLSCSQNPDWKGSEAIVARSAYAKQNKDIVTGVLKALDEGSAYAKQNPADAKQILTKTGFPLKVFDFLYPNNTVDFPVVLDDSAIKAMSDVNTFLVNNRLVKKSVDVKLWADSSYQPQ